MSAAIHHKLMQFETAFEVKRFISSKFKEIGAGSSRSVYKISKRRVIKIAIWNNFSFPTGAAQNRREVKITEKFGYCGYFAEVKWYHPEYIWIISERAKRISSFEDNLDFKEKINFLKSIGIYDLSYKDQWGRIGKRLVCVDYGASRYILDKYY